MTPEQQEQVNTALFAYWTARRDAEEAQRARGKPDAGNRAGVTAGGHLDRVAQLLANAARAAGAPAGEICISFPKDDPFWRDKTKKSRTLPGYFRPDKNWDVVVWSDGAPIVVIELKSQNGPSYGNNANNRAEEAIGNAWDFKRAAEEFLVLRKPWVAYVFVIEDDERSRKVRKSAPALPVDPSFNDCSYTDRIKELSHRLVEEGLYDAAWPVTTARPQCPGRDPRNGIIPCAQAQFDIDPCTHRFGWLELDTERHGYATFIAQMTAVIRAAYPA